MLITFSGLDGAGKTTLIREIKASLEGENRTVTVLTMYDDVALYSFLRSFRDGIKRAVRKGRGRPLAGGAVSHEPRELISDDSDAGWFPKAAYGVARSPFVRRCVYFFDLLIFLVRRVSEEKVKKNVVIMDRYFYDSLADVAGTGWLGWLYIRFFLFIVPTPDVSVLVNVSAEEAFARKAEHPLDYLKGRRAIYEKIFGFVHRPMIISNDDLNVTLRALEAAVAPRVMERG
ncbi:hypothetical protein MYX77_02035 [Acidobacteriia bacterium AH_259_A11_L15]|nr:hypothetical protein [Acidobacteriia bacterium AH_259_A11_L15]